MSRYFPSAEELSGHTIFPGVHIRTFAGEKMLVSVVDFESHSEVAEHSHPHEQVGILLEGRVAFTIAGEVKTLKPGDVWRIPGNTPHKVVVLDAPARAIDVFCPVREEYL